ncbi:hypothetical protein FOPG_07861 [Fusarium oxysporum f. sp. conglutinans race 2 54008]|uniref:Uncharacterized protein n=2 Tax=Fusarium oxysporum TaxID=5507 RepID=X0I0Q0_FUSOX|nr:hypothetical protein FOVG_03041 [Fusarium oxysporum f. sp. pisi HDV247]EXL77706.1 hypothetical protein FOPG_07861 [Fusarium oxysporum f. sp. conglutinans race 2 54008]
MHDVIVADICQGHRSGLAAFGSQPPVLRHLPRVIEMRADLPEKAEVWTCQGAE